MTKEGSFWCLKAVVIFLMVQVPLMYRLVNISDTNTDFCSMTNMLRELRLNLLFRLWMWNSLSKLVTGWKISFVTWSDLVTRLHPVGVEAEWRIQGQLSWTLQICEYLFKDARPARDFIVYNSACGAADKVFAPALGVKLFQQLTQVWCKCFSSLARWKHCPKAPSPWQNSQCPCTDNSLSQNRSPFTYLFKMKPGYARDWWECVQGRCTQCPPYFLVQKRSLNLRLQAARDTSS